MQSQTIKKYVFFVKILLLSQPRKKQNFSKVIITFKKIDRYIYIYI